MVEDKVMKYEVEISIDYSREIEASSEDEAIAIAENEIIKYSMYDCDVELIDENENEENENNG
jgi:hypothetical protein